MDQPEHEAFEAAWNEASGGLDALFDTDQLALLRSLGMALFTAGQLHGCRGAYDHALTVAARVWQRADDYEERTNAVG